METLNGLILVATMTAGGYWIGVAICKYVAWLLK